MGRTIDAHLTQNEIEWLLASRVSAGSIPSPPHEDPEPVQKHLTACTQCRQTLHHLESFMGRLRALEESNERVRTPQCPPDEVWTPLAAGLSTPEVSDGLLAHAAQCGYCGALLRATEDLAGDLKPEEQQLLATLASSRRKAGSGWPRG